MRIAALFFSCLYAFMVNAQSPVGTWHSQLPYSNASVVAQSSQNIYVANSLAYYTIDKEYKGISLFSTEEGMSELGLSTIAYDSMADILLLAYKSGRLDIIEKGVKYSIPDIAEASIIGSKSINHIYLEDSLAYLSTDFGIVVFDMKGKLVRDSYIIGENGKNVVIYAMTANPSYLFAATTEGIKIASRSEGVNLKSFTNWYLQDSMEGLPSGSEALFVVNSPQGIIAAVDSGLYSFNDPGWSLYQDLAPFRARHISLAGNDLIITQEIPSGGEVPDSVQIAIIGSSGMEILLTDDQLTVPRQAIRDQYGVYWVADLYRSLLRYEPGKNPEMIVPDGPYSNQVFRLDAFDGALWIAPGAISSSWNFTFNSTGIYGHDGYWQNLNGYNTPELESTFDIISVYIDRANGNVYAGSWWDGLYLFDQEGNVTNWDLTNSSMQGAVGDEDRTHVNGIAKDEEGNIWLANSTAGRPISVMTPGGDWQAFSMPNTTDVQEIVIDDFGQIWTLTPRNSTSGVLVLNPGGTVLDPSDDESKAITTAPGNGGLPTPGVYSIVKDHDGEIWLGTEEGIAIIYNPGEVFTGNNFDAQRIYIDQDGLGGEYLFEKEVVRALAVDAGNRKWVGTNNGVWLMSEDGSREILHFDEDNSPLLSNVIMDIAIDDKTGMVWFGTAMGVIGYQGSAIEGRDSNDSITIYPNPVRPDYNGPIAIKNLSTNAEVHITDVQGNLVYRTTAAGGQALWDGYRLDGQRPQTGVYLIFVSSPDGSTAAAGKLLFVK